MTKPLDKENLGEALSTIFPGVLFVRNRPVPDVAVRSRPDYQSVALRLIVQFDGAAHYTKPARILRDEEENRAFLHAGYEVVRIPYFVQMSTEVVVRLFGTSRQYKQRYPHGFVHRNAVLPAAFCCLGIERFLGDLDRFSFIRDEIFASLKQKVSTLGEERLVYPAGGEKALLTRLASRGR